MAMDRRLIALLPGTEATPGTRFNYSDANAVLAAATVARVSARDLLAFARHALFKPLGFVKSSGTGITPVCITLAVDSAFALWTRRGVVLGRPSRGRGSKLLCAKAALTGAPTRPFTGTRIQTQYWGPSRHLLGSPLHGGAVLEANLLHGAHGCAAGLAPVGPAHLCLRAKQNSEALGDEDKLGQRLTPSFFIALWRCALTVRSVLPSSYAICLLSLPRATRSKT